MDDRAAHRAAVEAGYVDLAGYVAKYRDEPEYPGASVRTTRLVWSSTGELGEVRLMDYGSGSKKRYRVAVFCPGRVVELPGDTPKVEPEADIWCGAFSDANRYFELYVDREHRDGWKKISKARDRTRPSLHGDGHVGPVALPATVNTDDATILNRARVIVSGPPPHYSYGDVGEALVSYLRGERDAKNTMQTLDYLALDYECDRRRHT